MVKNPYSQIISKNIILRNFPENTSENDLIWHQDLSNRFIYVISGNDWKLQFDNHLPIILEINQKYYIPKLTFHRIIKGNSSLKILIEEIS